MKQIITFIFIFSSFAQAMLEKNTEDQNIKLLSTIKNVTCHICRYSKNSRGKLLQYYDCKNPNCYMTYCARDVCKEGRDSITEYSCVYCRQECCCYFIECRRKHRHCFPYNRRVEYSKKQKSKKRKSSRERTKDTKKRKKNNDLDQIEYEVAGFLSQLQKKFDKMNNQ